MRQPVGKPDRLEFAACDVEGIVTAGQFQRHGDILQRRHVGHEVKVLEDDPDMAAAKPRHGVFRKRGDVGARHGDPAGVDPLQTAHHHQQCRLARP